MNKENTPNDVRVGMVGTANLRLSMDMGTRLQLEIDGLETRVKSQLIGMVPNDYLAIKTPHVAGLAVLGNLLQRDRRVIVRYVFQGSIFGFQSTIIGNIGHPRSMLLLAYPRVVEIHSLRSAARIDCAYPAVLMTDRMDWEGVIVDLSATGCCIEIKNIGHLVGISLGTEVDISFELPGSEGQHRIPCVVRNSRREGVELTRSDMFDLTPHVSVGLEFSDISSDTKQALDHVLESISSAHK